MEHGPYIIMLAKIALKDLPHTLRSGINGGGGGLNKQGGREIQ